MLRLAVIAMMIPTVCDPPPEPPPYTCRQLPAEVDFGEVQTFTRRTTLVGLDNRDRPELGSLAAPFSTRLTSAHELALALEFTPGDALLHFDSLQLRLHPDCDLQTIRLAGRGTGALETPSLNLEFGPAHRLEVIELAVPLINTRREPIDVWSSSFATNRVELAPRAFSLQPFEHREVTVRVTCLREGHVNELLRLQTVNQTLDLVISGDCVP